MRQPSICSASSASVSGQSSYASKCSRAPLPSSKHGTKKWRIQSPSDHSSPPPPPAYTKPARVRLANADYEDALKSYQVAASLLPEEPREGDVQAAAQALLRRVNSVWDWLTSSLGACKKP